MARWLKFQTPSLIGFHPNVPTARFRLDRGRTVEEGQRYAAALICWSEVSEVESVIVFVHGLERIDEEVIGKE
jgi:hypothetical protein